jgi:phosphatidylserine/phosphatidylglycerophosphate/cardiolipin synthase-like enzyme
MSRAGRSASAQLMDHVVGAGQLSPLLSFLATTFELDPDFLEYDFVPSMIGLSQRDDRSTRARLQLEEHLARLDAAVVMMDASCYRGARPCSLRLHLTAKQERGVKLHAKVAVFVHEDCVRLLVGSANLTAAGYRSNREVAYSLSASEKKPEAARLLLQAIEPMHRALSGWWTEQAATVQQHAVQLLSKWSDTAEAGEQESFVWSGTGQPLWRAFAEAWPRGQSLERLTIVSPFWSHESERGPVEGLLRALRERGARTDGAKVELLAGAVASAEGVYVPQAHPSFAAVDFRKLGVAATLHAVDPRILEEGYERDGRLRALHAKVLLASGGDTTVAYSGSANFTRKGWGFDTGPANIEAGIILVREGKAARALRSLRPETTGTGQPLEWLARAGNSPRLVPRAGLALVRATGGAAAAR